MDITQTEPMASPAPAMTEVAVPVEPVAIGLGCHAYTSWMLNRLNLRAGEYPFDQLASDPGMVADIIEDDFRALMDPQGLVGVPDARGRVQYGHRDYSGPYRRPVVFTALDPSTDEGRSTLDAAIERFRAALALPGRKVFVVVAPAERGSPRLLHRLAAVLRGRTTDAHLVAIRTFGSETALPVAHTRLVVNEPGLAVYDFTPRTTMQAGLSFADNRDNDRLADIVRWHLATEDATIGDKSATAADETLETLQAGFGRIEEQTAALRGGLADHQTALRSLGDQGRSDRDARAQTDASIARLEAAVAALSQDLAAIRHESYEQQRQGAGAVEHVARTQNEASRALAAQVSGTRSLVWAVLVLTVLVGAAVVGSYLARATG